MSLAFAEAESAGGRGEVPIGCVIVDQSGNVMAKAGNQKSLENAIYVVKITAISSITEGLRVEIGAGVAVIKLNLEADAKGGLSTETKQTVPKKPAGEQPVLITNDILMNLLDLSEDEPRKES